MEEITDRFVVDARHHVFEQHKRFFFELDERILLPVSAQPDALFQMVEREQMVLPLRIDHIEDDAALEPAHQVPAKLFFFFFVTLGDRRDRRVQKLIITVRAGIGARRLHVNAKLRIRLG